MKNVVGLYNSLEKNVYICGIIESKNFVDMPINCPFCKQLTTPKVTKTQIEGIDYDLSFIQCSECYQILGILNTDMIEKHMNGITNALRKLDVDIKYWGY